MALVLGRQACNVITALALGRKACNGGSVPVSESFRRIEMSSNTCVAIGDWMPSREEATGELPIDSASSLADNILSITCDLDHTLRSFFLIRSIVHYV